MRDQNDAPPRSKNCGFNDGNIDGEPEHGVFMADKWSNSVVLIFYSPMQERHEI